MQRILFVCLGNICRSPLAEGIARHIIEQKGYNVRIDSAGTSGWHEGEPPCPNSIKVAAMHGIDIASLRARRVRHEDKTSYDIIVALDSTNKADLEAMGFKNVRLLGDFGGFNGQDVPDPYYFEGFEGFHHVYAMIEKAVNDLLSKVVS
jgi:protein-tyrosine phosphatase